MTKTHLDLIIEDNVVKSTVETPQRSCVNVGKILLDKLMTKPNFIGQVDALTGQEHTFGQMRDRSIRCALWLKKQGILPGDVIMFNSHNQLDNVNVLLATLSIGAVFNPVYDTLNTEGTRRAMSISKPKMAFTNEKNAKIIVDAAKLEGLDLKVIVIGNLPDFESFSQIIVVHDKREIDSFQCTEITKEDRIAAILSSSGTTGLPKGVVVGHSSLSSFLDNVDTFNLQNRTILLHTTLAWIGGLMFNVMSIYYEAKRIVSPPFNEDFFGRTIEKFQTQWALLLPCNIHCLLKSDVFDKYDLSSLKIVIRVGCHLSSDVVDALAKRLPNAFIVNGYGMTECCPVSLQTRYSVPESCGQLIKNVKIKVIDLDTGKALIANQLGEICIESPSRMLGYYKNPEATRESIDENGWFHSGDIGYYSEKGELFVIDRIKTLIKYQNYHISPVEVEFVISSHPAVKDVIVVSVSHDIDEEDIVALVTKEPKTEVTERELIDLVASKLEDHKRLRGGVIFLNELPYTPSGKAKRLDLKILAEKLVAEKTTRLCKMRS